MRNRFSRTLAALGAALALVVLLSASASAQTALTSTTTAAAITDTAGKVINLTSATGITASSASTSTWLLIDKELMSIQALNGTYATVIRGWGSTRAMAHVTASTVYFIPAATATLAYVPFGACTRANLPYVPVAIVGDQDMTNNGTLLDCLGGQWVTTNVVNFPIFGTTVASAGTIAATGTYFKVSGTTNVVTITLPAGWAPGMSLVLEPTGLWSTTAAGNILLATTGVVGKALTLTWNGTKWVPSY